MSTSERSEQAVTVKWQRPGPHAVREGASSFWTSRSMQLSVPVTVRYPRSKGRHRAIVFSHGGMGHHDNYAEIAGHWASHGFVVLHPRHPDGWVAVAEAHPELEMDPKERTLVWQKDPLVESFLISMVFDWRYWLSRAEEVLALIEIADRVAKEAGFEGDLDLSGVGVSGHSYGAYTTLVVAGARVDLPRRRRARFHPPSVVAAVALSPSGPGEKGLTTESFEGIEIPLMAIMGSNDIAARGQGATWRRKAYDLAMNSPDRHLAIIDDIDHALGGMAMVGRGHFRDDAEARSLVYAHSLAFWRATLAGDATAAAWLAGPSPWKRVTREHGP